MFSSAVCPSLVGEYHGSHQLSPELRGPSTTTPDGLIYDTIPLIGAQQLLIAPAWYDAAPITAALEGAGERLPQVMSREAPATLPPRNTIPVTWGA